MPAKTEKPQIIESNTLRDALKADGGSNRELAERAGISFRAIAEARSGFDTAELQQSRKRLGVISSMTRLAVCLDVDPGQVLRELGIDVSDAAIQKQIERARDMPSLEDPVLRAIRMRALTKVAPPGPVIGIVPWSPFSEDTGRGSIAKLLARSVLGSLDPSWDRDTNVKAEKDFMEAERRLASDEPDRPDCLLGLYDLPWRHEGEVDVIPLPGLYVRVGGLCTKPAKWHDILSGKSDHLPHALVIKGDVGERLLTGPVDYPSGRLIKGPLKTHDAAEIATQIRPYFVKDANLRDGFLFVADGPLVCAVQNHLRDVEVHLVGDSEWAPAVRFGFALRHDAVRFKEALEQAISEDLLRRALPRTVFLYLELLKLDLTNQVGLDLAELDRRVPGLDVRFIKLAQQFEPKGWKEVLQRAVKDQRQLDRSINRANGEPRREPQ